MKIAYVLSVFPSLSETFILNEILELRNNDIDVSIFSIGKSKDNIWHPNVEELRDRTFYFAEHDKLGKNLKRALLYLYFLITAPRRFLRALCFAARHGGKSLRKGILWAREFEVMGIDHIHAHFADLPTEIVMIVSFLTGIPYSFSIHSRDLFVRPKAMAQKLRNAKAVITHCDYNKDYILKKWPVIHAEMIEKVHCAIDHRHFVREKEYSKKDFNILSVGRLVKKKGFGYLIDACGKLKRSGVNFTCTIVGTGPEEKMLKQKVEEQELSSAVFIVGAKDRAEIKALLEKATLFVLPFVETENGDRDSLPTVIKEAMAMEVPVVTSESESIRELVQDGAGILVAPHDSDTFADAMKRLYNTDEKTLKSMGKKGKEIIVKSFTIQSQSDKLISFFTKKIQDSQNR